MNGIEIANKSNNRFKLTDDQKKAYDELIPFIKADFDEKDYKRALCGPAGTGKTFLVKTLLKDSGMSYSSIGLSAPTHKACRILSGSIGIPSIKVNTLQSDVGLKPNFNIENFDINNPPFDPRGRVKIENCKLYIVDEASMIPKGLCVFLEKYCVKNKCKLIYIGDSYQLPPVNEKYSYAFKDTKSYQLKQIVRQGDDNPVRELLNALREDIDKNTFTFLSLLNNIVLNNDGERFNVDNTKGYCICKDNDFVELLQRYFSDETLTKNIDFVKLIAYTNPVVSGWNKVIRNTIIKDSERAIITNNDLFLSYITIVNIFNDCIIKNSEEYIIKDIVNWIHPKYGMKGFMVRFQAIHGGKISTPLFVIDHTDPFSVSKYCAVLDSLKTEAERLTGGSRAQKWKEFFAFKEECLLLVNVTNKNNTKLVSGRSLDYGFALTAHKSQGSTFDTVFVDLKDMLFDKNGKPYTNTDEVKRRLYVACSRCKNKLYIRWIK